MAPLPEWSTARVVFEYVTGLAGVGSHSLQFRYAGTDRTATAAQERFASMLAAGGGGLLRSGWRVIAVKTYLAGETFSTVQAPIPALAAFLGTSTTAYARRLEARELTFQARGLASPRRCDFSLYGLNAGQNDFESFRQAVTPAMASNLRSFYEALVAPGSPFIAIDGSSLLWYPYVNMSYNGWWERRLRTA